MGRRRHRYLHNATAVIAGTLFVMLSPILLPVALILHSREQKRMRFLAETFPCLSCGRILGAESLRLADTQWENRLAGLTRDHAGSGIRFRIVRDVDAICPNCGTQHKFIAKLATFVPSEPMSGRHVIQKEGGRSSGAREGPPLP